MEEVFKKKIILNRGLVQIDWRIPLEMESIWRDAVLQFGEPKHILHSVLSSHKSRKERRRLPKLDFEKVKGIDSRKRIRVYGSDYWQAIEYAKERNVSTSSFLSSVLRMEWILSSGFKNISIQDPEPILRKIPQWKEEGLPWGA
ncbi:hypothetical protein EHQ64_03335 [Leptospira sarikeiensis]|uniref:DUF1564 family protein n=2 Tax=Leptospira sarikeiensis TaxID=2484943 RepID=A0A4R9KBP4_9LEPT|nr:hypothetical protein EHQ64_03335 [Leptospira sarikeiensis]